MNTQITKKNGKTMKMESGVRSNKSNRLRSKIRINKQKNKNTKQK